MQTMAIDDLIPSRVDAYGALDFDRRKNGISPRRLPAWTRAQVPDLMDVVVRMPSGVRLRFRTDAAEIGLSLLGTSMVTPPQPRRPLQCSLECMGQVHQIDSAAGNTIVLDPKRNGKFELQRGDADTLWFRDLPAGMKDCELWLPHNAFVELHNLHLNDEATLEAPSAETRLRWLHYGSSISHCMEADGPAYTWPAVAARANDVALQSLGFGGQCHLDPFVARTIRDSEVDIISLKLGINVINMDSMRERVFVPMVHGFLDTLREVHERTPIVIISPIYCPSAEHNPGPTVPDSNGKFVTIDGHKSVRLGCMSLTRVRELLADVVQRRQQAGDSNLHYVDGLTLFGAADAGDLPDDLHPNAVGYVRMGQRFGEVLHGVVETLAP